MNPHVTGGRPTHEGLAGVRPGTDYAAGGGGDGFGGLGGGGFGGFGGSMGQPIQLIRSGAHRPFAERALRNIGSGLPCHSGLMLAARITLPHFSVSSAISFPNS